METMTYTKSPPYSASHALEHNPASSSHQKPTTRPLHGPLPDSHVQHHNHPPLSAPASQESFVTLQSPDSSVSPTLHGSDTNLSQITSYTDSAASVSSSAGDNATQYAVAVQSTHASQTHRQRTPEDAQNMPRLNTDAALASPMSIASPVSVATTNGAKRTASGHVKNASGLPGTPSFSCHSRRESVSSTSSRAGELAATLKTRLGYAMAKVQHGWEHKSIQEVEQLAAQRARGNRYSMSHVEQQRPGTSGLSTGASRLSMLDSSSRGTIETTALPPPKRHSGNYAHLVPQSDIYTHGLQPAADIRPTSSSREYHYVRTATNWPGGHSVAMSPPRTPVNAPARRPPTIRTETQTLEAEREALQALWQLGSPHTNQPARGTRPSPPTTYLDTPRRVTFARSESNSRARPPSPEISQGR